MPMILSRARTAPRPVGFRYGARVVAMLVVAFAAGGLANPAAAQSTDPGPPITEIVRCASMVTTRAGHRC